MYLTLQGEMATRAADAFRASWDGCGQKAGKQPIWPITNTMASTTTRLLGFIWYDFIYYQLNFLGGSVLFQFH